MLKNYRPRAIETMAQNAIKHYDEELMRGEPCEIPIEELIELYFGIIIQYRNLSKNGAIHGITDRKSVVSVKSVKISFDLGGGRCIKNKTIR